MKIHIILPILLAYNAKCAPLNPSGTGNPAAYGEGWETDYDCQTGQLLYPFCAANDESPIDIQTHKLDGGLHYDDDNVCTRTPITWHYTAEPADVYKNDHTINVDPIGSKTAWFEDPWNNEASGSDDTVKRYCLQGLHFHWGLHNSKGSEHLLNGHAFPVEAHFVHYNCDEASIADVNQKYESPEQIEAARKQHFDYHELAVIGVWFVITHEDNPVMTQILDSMDEIETTNTCVCDIDESNACYYDGNSWTERPAKLEPEKGTCGAKPKFIDLSPLVDWTMGYYTYEGSLTTPPCTDDLRWFMLRKYAGISQRQMDRMRQITKPCTTELMAPNYRPIQENKDPVYSCDSYNGKYNQCQRDLKRAYDDYKKLQGWILNTPRRDNHDSSDEHINMGHHHDSRDIYNARDD